MNPIYEMLGVIGCQVSSSDHLTAVAPPAF